jgi:hypothetical protein
MASLLRRAVLGAGLLLPLAPRLALATPSLPASQRAFDEAIRSAWHGARRRADKEERRAIFRARAEAMCAALGDGFFEDWVCAVVQVVPMRTTLLVALQPLGSDGRVLPTIGNFSFAEQSEVRLDPEGELAAGARDLRVGRTVLAGGAFRPCKVRGFKAAYGREATMGDAEFQTPLFTVRFTALGTPAPEPRSGS